MKQTALVLSLVTAMTVAGTAEARSRWQSSQYNNPWGSGSSSTPSSGGQTSGSGSSTGSGTGTTTGSGSGTTTGSGTGTTTGTGGTSTSGGSTSTTGAYTTMAEVIAGMTSTPKAEAVAINATYNWQKQSGAIQDAPRGDAIPSWWSGERPTFCYGLQSWFQVFEATGNAATNTRVQVANLRTYVLLASTNKWVQVQRVASPYTDQYKYPFAYVGHASSRTESSGGLSIRPVYPQFAHGYPQQKYAIPNPSDVKATFTAMDVRLVVDNASRADDRSKAVYSLNVGADFYPDTTRMWNLGYAPGIGQGRMIRPTSQWRTATMLVPNASHMGVSYNELAQLPPPLN